MKFKKLRIKNYRGVDESTVVFGESGVTLVQGPNEVGKSSLAESIHILFQFKASSSDKAVRAIKPVHRDLGSEIELEAESGDYRFVYRKKFHKTPAAELEISAPHQANYTGDEAHDQANRILADTLDKQLWDALIIRQGDMIGQPDLSGKAALMTALDNVAGGGDGDRQAEGLFARVEAEYGKYYQKNGREGSVLTAAAADAETSRQRADAGKTLLDSIEKKADRLALLQREDKSLRKQLEENKSKLALQSQAIAEIDALEKELADAKLALKSAEGVATAAKRDLAERRRLVDASYSSENDASAITAELADLEPTAKTAGDRLAKAKNDRDQAAAKKTMAEVEAKQVRGDHDHLNNILHLDMMRERRDRLAAAIEKHTVAKKFLAAAAITKKLVGAIRDAELAVAQQEAGLARQAPKVSIESLGADAIELDGVARSMQQGEIIDRSVPERLSVALPGGIAVHIQAGGNLDALTRDLASARDRLTDLCRQGGVADSAEAMTALEKLRQAQSAIDEAQRVEQQNLRDLSHDEFHRRLDELTDTVARFTESRTGSQPLPANLDAAKAALTQSEAALAQATSLWEQANASVTAHEKEWAEISKKQTELQIAFTHASKAHEQTANAVAAARQSVDDATLEEKAQAAEDSVVAAQSLVDSVTDSITAKNPDKVRSLVAALTGSVTSMDTQLRDIEQELARLSTELAIRGEEGLFEEWQSASLEAEQNSQRLGLLRARADAARLLCDTMRKDRETARQNYIEPLKNKIEELGRVVWNPTFRVVMNEEDLSISSRTLDGVTVPFASLSGGAREQLALIFRAACAIIVSRHSGMPLILDDALGYTDAERLHLMGAVLARAAEQCQVVIFTCMPDRYSTVGNATVVRLGNC